jgi:hypothetical protein
MPGLNSYLLWQAFLAVMILSVAESNGAAQAKLTARERSSDSMMRPISV